MKKYITLLLTFFILCSLLGCTSQKKDELIQVSGVYFDTVIQIQAWDADPDVLENCKEMCQEYENKFSTEIPTSEIAQINSAHGKSVTVSDETIDILKTALYYCELSNGKFDITIAPVSKLWNFNSEHSGAIPSSEEISNALTHVGYQNIVLNGNTVTLLDPEAQIDLGGIAKGYIADRLKEYLLSMNVKHALINLGGNILAVGNRYDGQPFHIGIQKPFDKQNEPITQLEITDQSVVSSGNYERYFKVDDTIYHHILDTSTGYPCQNDLYQVTIISDNSVDGDALSTTCYALGYKEASKLIKQLDNVKAIFITSDYQLLTVE